MSPFTRAGLASAFPLLAAAACTPPPAEFNTDIAPYEAVLATFSNLAEDVELDVSYRSGTNLACKRTLTCSTPWPMLDTYASCSSIPGATSLSGTSRMLLDAAACSQYQSGSFPVASFNGTKTYTNFQRRDGRGLTTVSSGSPVTINFDGADWHYTIAALTRKTVSGTATVENFTLNTTTAVTANGRRAAESRIIESGVVRVADLVNDQTFDVTFDNVRFEDSACCYPTAGRITATVIDGATTTNEILQFLETACGAANFTDSEGGISSLTLTRSCE